MALPNAKQENVLEVGSARARLAKLYAEALLIEATKQNADAEAVGAELHSFVAEVFDKDPEVKAFLESPAVGKNVKAEMLEAALRDRASDLLRGLFAVLTKNNRLDLVPGIAATYRRMLDDRAGRVPVKVTTTVELTEAQRGELTATLSGMMNKKPVLNVRVDPDLLGGMVVQVGDRVIDTSVRTRLQALRSLLLDRGITHGS
jgi:F-type H+-transporting ATPase subunit delta